MNFKSMIPSLNEAVKIVIVVTILAVTGIGATIVAKAGKIIGR